MASDVDDREGGPLRRRSPDWGGCSTAWRPVVAARALFLRRFHRVKRDAVGPQATTGHGVTAAWQPVAMPPSLALLDTAGPPVASGESAGAPLDNLLGRLRAPVEFRPSVDPGLAGGLRAWLEDGVAAVPGANVPITVRPGPTGALVAGPSDRWPGRELRGALVHAVFRLAVTAGPPRAPFEDALAALAVDEAGEAVIAAVQRLSRPRRAQLRERVRQAAAGIVTQWCPPPAAWLPRTGETMIAPLAGGRVELRACADLMMGGPPSGRASVCVVRVNASGIADDSPSRRLLALLESLRTGAPPFRVASYDADRAELTVEDITEAHLTSAVQDVLTAVSRCVDGRGGGL